MTEQEIIEYCMAKSGASIAFPFGKQPLCVKANNKIFAQIYDGKITLKCEPSFGVPLREKFEGSIVRGYHCPPVQQPYFNTVYLDGKVPEYDLKIMLDHAYETVIKKLTKNH